MNTSLTSFMSALSIGRSTRSRLAGPFPWRRLALMLSAGVLCGCTMLGPDYRAPQTDLPSSWHEAQGAFAAADPAELVTWWRSFGDATLDRLIEQALVDNFDLNIARTRIERARAQGIQVAAGDLPTISVGGTGTALRSSKNLDWPPGIGTSRTWQAGFDASWELDLFGSNRRAVEAADADIAAVVDDRHALQVSLLAEVAGTYAELRMVQVRLAIAHDNIDNLRDGERLARQALQRGLGTSAEVMQASAERESAEAVPPLLEADIERLSHALAVLVGGFPTDWRDVLARPAAALPMSPALPLALPSELMRQRPDLRADERRLAGSTARIGVAEAARFPHFSIPLTLGTTASLLHDLFSGASLAWSAGLQGSQSLYDGGRARAGVTVAQAEAEAARLVYERDLRLALRDVEDALTALNGERRRQASLVAAVADSQLALERATRLYRAGLSSYLPVLTAQRASNRIRDALALSQWGEVRGAIALYKALGAGWQDDTDTNIPTRLNPQELS